MGIALLMYNNSAVAANAVNTDLTAASDPDFSQRNGHYIFTEPYNLLATAFVETSATRARFQCPTWNAIGEFIIFNANRSLNPPSNPQVDLYNDYPPQIPINEEFQVQVSNNLGAATEIGNVALLLGTQDWNSNVPRGRTLIPVRASFTVTPTLNAWSGPQILTFSASLRGGVYAVVGATLQGTNVTAFRLIFPRYRLYHGRKLRPGWVTQNAIGDAVSNQLDPWMMRWGEWGRWHTFEPFTCEVFGNVAGSITYQLFAWMVFMGEDISQLSQGLGGGM